MELADEELARRIKAEGLDVPVVLLAWDTRELSDFQARKDTSAIERTFLWQGDARTLVSIVKSVEDWRNAEHDAGAVGVQIIILVEDNVRYYSSFLPVMYTELLHHSQRVIVEGLNLSQKILRMRARPKILLCTTWEEAERAFERYADEVLGIISDVEFPRAGEKIAQAGLSSTDALYDDQWPAAAKALGLSGMRVAHLKGLDGMIWCLSSCGPIWCAGNFLEDGSPHAVVISGYDPNGNKLRINDPYEIYKYDAYRWFTHDGWCKKVRVAPFACQLWW